MTKTIALLGIKEQKGLGIYHKLNKKGYRILLVTKNAEQFDFLLKNILESGKDTETEIVECAKNSCWEADIIMIASSDFEDEKTLSLIKEVATQKIVVCVSVESEEMQKPGLNFPHSKLVIVSNIHNSELSIQGEDKEAVDEIRKIFHQQ